MGRAALAGLVCFVIVITIGFVLGSVRVLLVAPPLGELIAVVLELPLMLGACWLAASALTSRLQTPDRARAGLVMGAIAFACLMAAEFALAGLAFERSPMEQVLDWLTPEGALGLAGQILFALFAWIQLRRSSSI